MTKDQIVEAVARGWTHPETQHLTLDDNLARAIVEEVMRADTTPNLGCASTLMLISELDHRARQAAARGEEWPQYRTVDNA